MSEANYDESLVPEYTLPDPLVFNDGAPVRSAADWLGKRRAEVLFLFETEVYGKTPNRAVASRFELLSAADSCGGKARRKEVRMYFTDRNYRPYLELLISVPRDAE